VPVVTVDQLVVHVHVVPCLALQRYTECRSGTTDTRFLAARLSRGHRAAPVPAGDPDAALLRALVRAVSLVRRWLQARRDAAPRHGASERHRLRQPLPEWVPGPRSVADRPRLAMGLHHRA